MNKLVIILSIVLFSVALSSCGDKTSKEPAKEEASSGNKEEHEHENENTATLTQEQIKTIGIEFGPIEQKELTNSIKANGVLTVPNQNKAFVVPYYSGVVKSINVQPGSFVKEGQAIATIVNPGLIQMQQQLQQLNTQISLSEIEVKRQKELVEGNAAPLKKLQQVQTELATLKSQRSGIQQQLSGIGASHNFSPVIVVKAPISGTVSKVSAQLGSNVDVNTPIAEIVNNEQLHLDLYIYEKDLSKLKANQTIHFTITNNAGKEYHAEIFSIGTAFEAGSKTIPVHAKVMGDKAGLIDGMNITAIVSLDKSTVPAVPTDAIVSSEGKDFIFIVTDAHAEDEHAADTSKNAVMHHKEENTTTDKAITFEKIPVAKGTTDIGYSEITLLKDIPANAKVVTKGAFFILAKMTNTEGHGH
ncbi:MAG: efflux RND transporter periplasmic adaptor subunit [Ferruginibacter sp.]